MASTYSNLKIQLMATGENSGTWGNVTNVNLGTAIEQAMVETATVTFSSANVTLTLTDTNAAQNARALRLNLTGTTGGARDLIVPAIQKPYIVNNGTADTITVKVSGQTGIAVPASKTMLVYNNGTDVVDAINHLSALSLATALPISSGGTGSTSTTYANLESNVSGTLPVANGGTSATTLNAEAVVIGNATGAVKFVSPGTDGNVLTSNGTAWVSEAIVIPPSVPTGTIATFAGDPGAGWLECNGQIVSQSTYSDLYAKVGLLADAFQTTSYVAEFTNMDSSRPNTTSLYCSVAYGNSTYVTGLYDGADTNANRVYTSTDGLTWTARSFGWVSGTLYPLDIIYTDKFIAAFDTSGTAASNRNQIYTSTDGITWTARTLPSTSGNTVGRLAYNGSNLIVGVTTAITNRNGIVTSTDGITWTQRTTAVQTVGSSTGLAYGNNRWVIGGNEYTSATQYRPTIQTSTDGITWTYTSFLFNGATITGLNYLYDKFYLFLGGPDYSVGRFWTSTDGVAWTQNTELGRVLQYGFNSEYDSTRSLIYIAGGSNSSSINRNYIAMAISADFGATWQYQPIGADIMQTVTNAVVLPTNGGIQNPVVSEYGGLSVANGRIFINGEVRMHNVAAYTPAFRAFMKSMAGPYTYQTDTQFALPSAQYGMAGTAGPSNAAYKSSTVFGYATGGQKLYIKT